jgi:hypothetical protein
MQMLRAPNRFVFYSFPVEDSCLWFQEVPTFFMAPGVGAPPQRIYEHFG